MRPAGQVRPFGSGPRFLEGQFGQANGQLPINRPFGASTQFRATSLRISALRLLSKRSMRSAFSFRQAG